MKPYEAISGQIPAFCSRGHREGSQSPAPGREGINAADSGCTILHRSPPRAGASPSHDGERHATDTDGGTPHPHGDGRSGRARPTRRLLPRRVRRRRPSLRRRPPARPRRTSSRVCAATRTRSSTPSASNGGTITYATISEPLTFNLPLANDAGSTGYLGYVFEGLTETSWLDDAIEPALAESWERSDDGLEWTFRLRQDVSWHDGEPFTAHDVDFTFNRIVYNDDIPTTDRETFTFVYVDEATGEETEGRMTVTALGRPHRAVRAAGVRRAVPSARWAPASTRSTSSNRTWTRERSRRSGASTPTRRR